MARWKVLELGGRNGFDEYSFTARREGFSTFLSEASTVCFYEKHVFVRIIHSTSRDYVRNRMHHPMDNDQVPCLQELNLADNMLGDDGAEDLGAGLYGHPCLNHLVRMESSLPLNLCFPLSVICASFRSEVPPYSFKQRTR